MRADAAAQVPGYCMRHCEKYWKRRGIFPDHDPGRTEGYSGRHVHYRIHRQFPRLATSKAKWLPKRIQGCLKSLYLQAQQRDVISVIFLAEHQIHVLACVADYGSKSLKENEYLKIHAGRLTEPEMEALLNEKKPEMVLTQPILTLQRFGKYPHSLPEHRFGVQACAGGRLEPIRTRPFMCRIPRLPLNFWRDRGQYPSYNRKQGAGKNTPHFLMLRAHLCPVSFPCPL